MVIRTLPLLPPKSGVLVNCTHCAQCCTYVAIEVEEPNNLKNATDILWFLYHDHVSVVMERKDRWTLLFETRCRNLGDDLLCGIYEWRPHICRGYDRKSCEVNARGSGRTFRTPEEFLQYMQEKRARTYRLLEKRFLPSGNGGQATRATARKRPRTLDRAS